MLTTTRFNGDFIPSSRVSPLTAVDLLVQFLDHRHRSSAHSILVPVPILLLVPVLRLRSSLAPRPHTSSSRSRSAPSCRRLVAAAIGCLLASALTAATGRALLMLDQPILSSSSLYSSSQSRGAVLGVTSWPLVLLSAPTTAFPLPLPPLASPSTSAAPSLPLTMALTTALWRGRRRRGGRCLGGAHGMRMTARGMPPCCSQTSIDGPESALVPDGAGGA